MECEFEVFIFDFLVIGVISGLCCFEGDRLYEVGEDFVEYMNGFRYGMLDIIVCKE